MSYSHKVSECPWSVLGVTVNASSEKVRQAYHKLALRWHPDKNQGCLEAQKRFQRVKDAFDEIKRRRLDNSRPTHQSQRNNSQSHNASYAYRYTARQTRNPFGTAYGQTGCERPHTYHRARAQRTGNAWEETRQTAAKARMRVARPLNLAGCVFAASLLISSVALSTDLVWRANNRGKSFEDLINSLEMDDKSHVSHYRGPGRSSRRQTQNDIMETKRPQEP